MIALLFLTRLLSMQDPSAPNPDPAEPDSASELSMPGDSPTEAFGEPPQPEEAFLASGTVVSLEPEGLILRRRGEIDAEFILDSETSFFLEGEAVSFDEIPVGSEAELQFVLRGAERVVLELRVNE